MFVCRPVSVARSKMRTTKPDVLPWEETQDQWAARARRAVRDVNAKCEVRKLCLEFPARLQTLTDREGDRLRK